MPVMSIRCGLAATVLCASLAACHTDPSEEAAAQGDRLHDCMARSQQEMPGMSDRDRRKQCRDQVGHSAFEVPPTAAPAPVH